MKKRVTTIILFILMLFMLCGCSDEKLNIISEVFDKEKDVQSDSLSKARNAIAFCSDIHVTEHEHETAKILVVSVFVEDTSTYSQASDKIYECVAQEWFDYDYIWLEVWNDFYDRMLSINIKVDEGDMNIIQDHSWQTVEEKDSNSTSIEIGQTDDRTLFFQKVYNVGDNDSWIGFSGYTDNNDSEKCYYTVLGNMKEAWEAATAYTFFDEIGKTENVLQAKAELEILIMYDDDIFLSPIASYKESTIEEIDASKWCEEVLGEQDDNVEAIKFSMELSEIIQLLIREIEKTHNKK